MSGFEKAKTPRFHAATPYIYKIGFAAEFYLAPVATKTDRVFQSGRVV
jgi:hypothetical protein